MIIRPSIVKNVKLGNDITRGLVGYWPLDDKAPLGGTTYDRSGNGNNAALLNDVKSIISTRGRVFDFDGVNDQIKIANTPSTDILAGFTVGFSVSIWVKFDTTSAAYIISKASTTGNQWAWLVKRQTTTAIRFYLSQNGSTLLISEYPITTGSNVWYHFVGVWKSGEEPVMYCDDIAYTDSTPPSTASSIHASNFNLLMGIAYDGTTELNGQLSEAIIYNRALSQSEVTQIHLHGIERDRDPIELWTAASGGAVPPTGTLTPYYYQNLLAG